MIESIVNQKEIGIFRSYASTIVTFMGLDYIIEITKTYYNDIKKQIEMSLQTDRWKHKGYPRWPFSRDLLYYASIESIQRLEGFYDDFLGKRKSINFKSLMLQVAEEILTLMYKEPPSESEIKLHYPLPLIIRMASKLVDPPQEIEAYITAVQDFYKTHAHSELIIREIKAIRKLSVKGFPKSVEREVQNLKGENKGHWELDRARRNMKLQEMIASQEQLEKQLKKEGQKPSQSAHNAGKSKKELMESIITKGTDLFDRFAKGNIASSENGSTGKKEALKERMKKLSEFQRQLKQKMKIEGLQAMEVESIKKLYKDVMGEEMDETGLMMSPEEYALAKEFLRKHFGEAIDNPQQALIQFLDDNPDLEMVDIDDQQPLENN